MIPKNIQNFIKLHHIFHLSTLSKNQEPYSTPLFYSEILSVDKLIFLSEKSTNHITHLKISNLISGSIAGHEIDPDKIKGLQFKGVVTIANSDLKEEYWNQYTDKFRFLKNPKKALQDKINQQDLWIIELIWLRLINNQINFGHKEEWTKKQGINDGK